MKGVTFTGNERVEILNFPDPTPGPNEVILEVKASGMCGSDLHQYRAAEAVANNAGPVIVGHEPCGVVVAVGSNVSEKQARIGARVMVHHYDGCGVCPHCLTSWNQMCIEGSAVYGTHDHGGHAHYLKVAAHTLLHLPDEVSFAAGAAISCGTGTAWGGLKRLGLAGDHTIAIFGQGPVGLSGTQLAVEMGARVIAIDINQERCDMAKDFGAHETINLSSVDNIEDVIKQLTHGQGADVVMETSAAPSARVQSVQVIKPWGKVCYVGWGKSVEFDDSIFSTHILRKQATLIGHWTFSKVWQIECARFIADRGLDVDRLFTHRWRIDQADEAYKLFNKGGTGKGVFLPSE